MILQGFTQFALANSGNVGLVVQAMIILLTETISGPGLMVFMVFTIIYAQEIMCLGNTVLHTNDRMGRHFPPEFLDMRANKYFRMLATGFLAEDFEMTISFGLIFLL